MQAKNEAAGWCGHAPLTCVPWWLQHSPHPHPFQCSVQLGFPESHRPADLEIGNQAERPQSLVKETTLAGRQPHRDAIHRHNDAVLGGEDICRPHVKYDRIVPNKRI